MGRAQGCSVSPELGLRCERLRGARSARVRGSTGRSGALSPRKLRNPQGGVWGPRSASAPGSRGRQGSTVCECSGVPGTSGACRLRVFGGPRGGPGSAVCQGSRIHRGGAGLHVPRRFEGPGGVLFAVPREPRPVVEERAAEPRALGSPGRQGPMWVLSTVPEKHH